MRSVLRACLSVLIALAILEAYPAGFAMAAPIAGATAEKMDAPAAPHDCSMCEKEKSSPAKTSCMQNFCAAPCIVSEQDMFVAAYLPVPLPQSFARLHEWRDKPLVSPA
jgi:hypothetical protein